MANFLTNRVLSFGDAVSDTGTVKKYPLGTLRMQDGATYRYVQRSDATVSFAAGDLVYRAGGTSGSYWQVTGDISDVTGGHAVGVAQSSISNSSYGWVLTKGLVTNLKKKTGTTNYRWISGQFLVPAVAATDDGRVMRWQGLQTGTILSATINANIRKALERIVGYAAANATKAATSGSAFIDLE